MNPLQELMTIVTASKFPKMDGSHRIHAGTAQKLILKAYEERKAMISTLSSIRLMLLVHPDYSVNSEFADRIAAIDDIICVHPTEEHIDNLKGRIVCGKCGEHIGEC